jgi:oxygen-independent coproporphyrinogen-3 oxidase
VHLYFHVPFCARRCSYCDFAIAVRREVPSASYAEVVLREWSAWLAQPVWDVAPLVETIYFGGGTPSRLAPAAIAALLDRIQADRSVAHHAEITLEANPDDVTREAARAWRTAGITRLSLGAQSFSAEALRWMHRTHDPEAITRAVETARTAGFASLSLDLIFALPPDVARSWEADLDQALALAPEHLSLYGLTTEPGTPLARWTARGQVHATDESRYAVEYLLAHERLEAAGLEHYEVSSAARPGHRARHNAAYWNRAPYIGLGPSAHSGFGDRRQWNLREWAGYERAVRAGTGWVEGSEALDARAVRLEQVYLGLRTADGVPRSWVPDHHRVGWTRSGWARVEGDRLRLTAEGWLRLDALAAAIC